MRHLLVFLAATTLLGALRAQVLVNTDRLAYTGTVTRYDSQADAQSGVNAVATFSLGTENRDLRLQLYHGFAPALADQYYFGTNWTPPGSPSNTASGYIQVPLQFGAPNIRAFWDQSLTRFTFSAQDGGPATHSRLWDGTTTAANQGGAFIDYQLSLIASGLTPALWDSAYGTYWSQSEPSAVEGHFAGLFHNTTVGGAGYYTFDFVLNLDSWAYSAFGMTEDRDHYIPTLLAAPTAVPEPATYGVLGVLALLGLLCWRDLAHPRG